MGEASVIIAVSSAHRGPSLLATQLAIDTLKADAPIWKKEMYKGEESSWKVNKESAEGGNVTISNVLKDPSGK